MMFHLFKKCDSLAIGTGVRQYSCTSNSTEFEQMIPISEELPHNISKEMLCYQPFHSTHTFDNAFSDGLL